MIRCPIALRTRNYHSRPSRRRFTCVSFPCVIILDPAVDFSGYAGREFSSETQTAFADLMNAIHATPTVDRLRRMHDGNVVTPSGMAFPVAPHYLREHADNVEYAIQNRELFASAYAQFVATQSQHPELMRELNHALESYPDRAYAGQWPHHEFQPIHQAFRALFRGLNWTGSA